MECLVLERRGKSAGLLCGCLCSWLMMLTPDEVVSSGRNRRLLEWVVRYAACCKETLGQVTDGKGSERLSDPKTVPVDEAKGKVIVG